MKNALKIIDRSSADLSLVLMRTKEGIGGIIFLLCFIILFSQKIIAQSACPSLTVSPDATVCNNCTTLSATVQGTVATTSYSVGPITYNPFSYTTGTNVLVNIDDHWSNAVTIPFCFSFYGNSYTQCVIGSNAVLSFVPSNAGGYNTWAISTAIPSATPADLLNCILAPWHDIDPSITSNSTPEINWSVSGTAPCRAFVVNWTHVSMYSSGCHAQIATSQVVLYETTNIIDINIENKPTCSGWNSGAAIEGIQDATGSQAVPVPGRNYPTQWTASNDGQRFTPTGAPDYTLTWYDQANTAIGTTPTISVCPTVTTTYTATLVNNTCAGPITITEPVTITVCGAPGCSFVAHGDTVCVGATISLSASLVTGATYKWRGPNGYISSLQNPSIPNATLSQTGWYYAKDTITGCTTTDSVFVLVNAGSVANAGIDQTICIGSDVTLAGSITTGTATGGTWTGGAGTYNPNNTSSNAAYTPNTAEETAGTVTLTFTPDNTGGTCTGVVDQMIITINQFPTANAGLTQFVCPGSTITLAGSVGGAAISGSWGGGTGTYSPDNTALNAVYTPSAAEVAADSVTLTLTTNDPPGLCTSASADVTFHFYKVPVVNFAVDTAAGCPGFCTGFSNSTVVGGGDNIATWVWNFGDGTSGSDLMNPSHCFSLPGFYNVSLMATSNHGCVSSLSKANFVQVYSIPVAEFNFSPFPASIIEPMITFNNQSSSDVTYWNWDFGDGVTLSPNTANPAHSYPDSASGKYMVTLLVHNIGGCYDTVMHEVIIGPGFTFFIPNAFSPGENGINDHFFGTGTGIKKYDLWIFDRWGNMIFHTDQLAGKWDGSDKNAKEKELLDVYVWKVELNDVFNKKHNYIGTVTLVK